MSSRKRGNDSRADPTSLYLTEDAIADRVGVTAEKWHENARVLERAGLPKPDPLFDGRRYWPAVKAFLDRRNGIGGASSALAPDGEENWHERRARAKAPAA
jgi:hypothetical protein